MNHIKTIKGLVTIHSTFSCDIYVTLIFEKTNGLLFTTFTENLKQAFTCTHNICDIIKGNKSLVENVYFYFLTPLYHNFKMLHFDVNPITIGYLVTGL